MHSMSKQRHVISVTGILVSLLLAAGLAWAGSQGGLYRGDAPLFAQLVALAFVVQWLVFIPAFLFQTERCYDLTGSLTYITVTISGLLLAGQGGIVRLCIAAMVVVWALRLGSFLFLRILRDGSDGRFDRIKPDFLRFLMTWTLQGLWVSITLGAALAALTSAGDMQPNAWFYLGAAIWLFGFLIEVVADEQKRRFRRDTRNQGQFIQHGLWRYSRHPNYVGEILLWLGISIAVAPALSGWQLVTLVSPLFVYLLLTRVSGVPLLEARARRRWGDHPDYAAYLERTPILFFRFRR